MSDTQYSIWWLTYKARGGNSVLLKDTAQSHPSRRRERCDYYVHKMMDHTYIPLILPTAVCAAHITYQWQRCNGLQKSNGNLTLIMPHFWFTFESPFHCIRWLLTKKKKRGGKNKVRIYFSWTWKFSLFVPAMSFNLLSHYSKWKWKLEPEAFVFEQREGSRLWMFQM